VEPFLSNRGKPSAEEGLQQNNQRYTLVQGQESDADLIGLIGPAQPIAEKSTEAARSVRAPPNSLQKINRKQQEVSGHDFSRAANGSF
jgi:hypothetical protein